ncbi:CBS-domain-containing protein [Meredithblackwellia eburnea MCA 4105]
MSQLSSSGSSRTPSQHDRRRTESIYSPSQLSIPSPSGVNNTQDILTDTRRKQSRRDEAIRKKIESELSRKRPTTQKKQHAQGATHHRNPKPKQGTVSALRPLPALTVPHSITVSDASQLCAAKRTDCVLVVDDEEHLCGIFTAKDLAFRVVGDGLDPRSTPVSQIMTPNPMVTRDTTSATEALQTMVTKGFRHLPVCNEDGDVVGLLDITKVFNESLEKLEKAYGSSQKLYSALEGAQEQFGGAGAAVENNPLMAYVQALRDKMSFPDLGSILDARTTAATVGIKTTVRDAARLMRERRTTAVCVMEGDGARKIAGIFTSKDVVLRVIAAGLDSRTCSVVRVMTPHPDVALPTLSIQDALRKMHTGHYLNLPVVDEDGGLVGIVDVLKLTYATLEQVNSIGGDSSSNTNGTSSGGGPLWGHFFAATAAGGHPGDDDDTESVVSTQNAASDVLHTPLRHRSMGGIGGSSSVVDTPGSEVFPGDSASVVNDRDDRSDLGFRSGLHGGSVGGGGAAVPPPDVDDGTYLFKFVAPGGTTHRFQARYDSHEFIVDIIRGKLVSDPFFAPSSSNSGGEGGAGAGGGGGDGAEEGGNKLDPGDFKMSYFDDDGDLVLMTADRDVTDAVNVARKQGKDRVVVHLRGGKAWDDELARRGTAGSKVTEEARERERKMGNGLKAVEESLEEQEEDEEEGEVKVKKDKKRRKKTAEEQADELVFGFLQKDQLLPASIAVLAAAIVGVFAVSKATGGK